MSFRTKVWLVLVLSWEALLYAFGLLFFCHIISWGAWYSIVPYDRLQVAALLHGQLALSHNPSDLQGDLCWSENGVNQVWGLGIPLWQLPFEALARLFGFAPFPDRITLGLFMALGDYVVFTTWFRHLLNSDFEQATHKSSTSRHHQWVIAFAGATMTLDWPTGDKSITIRRHQWLVAFGAVTLILFFPPLINLLRYRMGIWEDVVVYEYFYGILLFCALLAFGRNPKWRRFCLLCVMAGLGGFIRPTLVFYGFATVIMAVFMILGHDKNHPRINTKFPLRALLNPQIMLGLLLFIACGGLLFITNYLRFGSGFEFGHRLNLQGGDLLPSVYSTRFAYPFKEIPFREAARELFGALFQVKHFNGFDWYASGFFPGQSPAFRWREFSFTTYDLSYAICISLAWLIGIYFVWRKLRRSETQKSEHGKFQCPSLYLMLWSLLASLPLIGFYMKVPAIASRYMLDFAPAFTAALVGLWCWVMGKLVKRKTYPIWAVCFLSIAAISWLGSRIIYAHTVDLPPRSQTKQDLIRQDGHLLPGCLPREYKIGDEMNQWRIPYNGEGWNPDNGEVRLCAIFFVDTPKFLELEFAAAPNSHVTETDLKTIQAKVGSEFLKQTSITRTNEDWIVRFDGPKEHRFQQGLQPFFLAMIPPDEIGEYTLGPSPWLLKKLSW